MFRSELLQAWRIVFEEIGGDGPFLALTDADADADADRVSGDRIPEVRADGSIYALDFIGLISFQIDIARRLVVGRKLTTDLTDESLAHALDDHCAPRILAHEGRLVLHGSSVSLEDGLAVFLGETGAGKSTLAASFEKAGHHMLGDDALVVSEIDGQFHGEATYRSLRLFPQSVSAIYGEEAETSPMAHYSAKVHVEPRHTAAGAGDPFRIGAIFYLKSDGVDAAVEARLLTPRDACLKVLAQSFALDPQDSDHALQRLTQVSQLVTHVPVYELSYPRDYALLPDVHETIKQLIAQAQPTDRHP